MKTCMRVVLCQMKNGLPSFLALSMKPLVCSTSTSSKVSMSYLALRPSCQFWRPAMFGNGAQRSLVLDLLLADLAPARHHGGVVDVGGPGMDEVARAVLVDPVLRIVEPVRVRHGVEMVEIAEELVEAVHRRQVLVQVAQMVLAELAGLVALRLEHGGEGTASAGMPTSAPAWPTVVSPVRSGISPVMKLARPAVQLASA